MKTNILVDLEEVGKQEPPPTAQTASPYINLPEKENVAPTTAESDFDSRMATHVNIVTSHSNNTQRMTSMGLSKPIGTEGEHKAASSTHIEACGLQFEDDEDN